MRKPNKNKATYKGPYPNNPNLKFQNIKKSMRTETDGPTVDAFSSIDTTTNTGLTDSEKTKHTATKTKRPTKEKTKSFSITRDAILAIVFSVVSTGVGIVIYSHSNRFVSIEKDVDYIKDNVKDQKDKIEKVSDQATSTDRKIDLLSQKFDIKLQKK
jgi:hypothetical protein